MKYSEFKAEVEKLGFTYSNRCEKVAVEVDGQPVMDISTGRKYIVDNFWDEYQQLNETTQEQLFDLAFQLAKTPLAEREEEKRYRVKFPGITRDGRNIYLMRQSNRDGTHGIDWSPEEYIFDDFPDGYLFTEKEIKSINEHYWHFAEEGEEDE